MSARRPFLGYVVHDLGDPAVARRLRMLAPFLRGAVVAGFHRAEEPPAAVAGFPAIPLGRTRDAAMAQRLVAVARARAGARRLLDPLREADAFVGRQLEGLWLAAAARDRLRPGAPLLYELLDVHRLLRADGAAGRALRAAEGALLRRCSGVVVSSPAFVREHLRPAHETLPPVHLVENKVLAAEDAPPPPRPAPGPPWRVGWFGMLRCRRSLLMLRALAERRAGLVEVHLHGRPARSAIPDFDALVGGAPGLRFHGPYDRARDLPRLYGSVHAVWALDFFEEGLNSEWLLPNRLYEGAAMGAVPLARARTETGAWLRREGAGVLLGEPVEEALGRWFDSLAPEGWARETEAVARIPRARLVDGGEDGARLAAALGGGEGSARGAPAPDAAPAVAAGAA